MKYSIIIPYHKRLEHFNVTLITFCKYYEYRDDVEIIVVEDLKNFNHENEHNNLLTLIKVYSERLNIIHLVQDIDTFNPARAFNMGVKCSSGEFIILTNPECCHEMDILSGLDGINNLKDVYVVCACKNTSAWVLVNDDLRYDFSMWYQHSSFNRALHFCSVISKDNYDMIGGFDENYIKGIAYEDDDFRDTVINKQIPIIIRDDLVCIHLNHDSVTPPNHGELVSINLNYYNSKWRS